MKELDKLTNKKDGDSDDMKDKEKDKDDDDSDKKKKKDDKKGKKGEEDADDDEKDGISVLKKYFSGKDAKKRSKIFLKFVKLLIENPDGTDSKGKTSLTSDKEEKGGKKKKSSS